VIEPQETDPAISEINDYRAAARRIARNEGLSPLEKRLGLVRLAERARAETELPTWVQQGIWREAGGILWDPPAPKFPGDPMEQACRLLVTEGYIRCPRCHQSLPQAVEFERWAGMRRQYVAQLQAHEGAVK
jgi:hypothetical protein